MYDYYLGGSHNFAVDLDIGSGIPTEGNVHEVAQKAAPEARVVYVDTDPWPSHTAGPS